MSSPDDGSARAGPRRTWRIPPALLHEPGTLLEGTGVLKEVPGDLGTLLWQTVRDVSLWADTPPDRRAGLFQVGTVARRQVLAATAQIHETLRADIYAISSVMLSSDTLDPEKPADACLRVARWADDYQYPCTALAFAQSAALTVPSDAALAREVGRRALGNGERTRGESWFRRAVGLARRAGDWASYCHSLVELGAFYEDEDEFDNAREYYLKASRAARRFGIRESRGIASIGLVRVALRMGSYQEGLVHADVAWRNLGLDHLLSVAVALDFARLWIEVGNLERATLLLEWARAQPLASGARMLVLGLLARARVALANPYSFSETWMEAWSLVQAHPHGSERDRAVIDLAISAAAVGSTERMRAALAELSVGARHPESRLMREFTVKIAEVAGGDSEG